MFTKIIPVMLCLAALTTPAFAHDPSAVPTSLRTFHAGSDGHLQASFLMMKNDSAFLETETGEVMAIPFADLSAEDQHFVRAKAAQIERLNRQVEGAKHGRPGGPFPMSPARHGPGMIAVLIFAALGAFFLLKKRRLWPIVAMLTCGAVLVGFKPGAARFLPGTDPLFMDAAFRPFKPNVTTRWDNTWFYVESNGIPTTHPMMTGITKWQQQVPIPQCYNGANAWQIPLNPVLAAAPVPVNPQHFLRGAVAIAANGVPIFNPYTNTGVDAFLDGQLDQWGGHSGRADDYHYHIAPLFLDTQTTEILPIAFALDGFAVYAGQEPDGSPMLPLDANHGHFEAAGRYHYHGTAQAPYMIGNMVGKVTEDATLQIVPQSRATGVRPALTPLNGATITDCQPNLAGKGYILTYTRNGQTYKVDYSWTPGGVYTYRFITPSGTTTETYNGQAPCEMLTATDDPAPVNVAVEVFPNPTPGAFSLKVSGLNTPEAFQVCVFDLSGRLVAQRQATPGGAPVIGFDGLPGGVYVVKVMFKKGGFSRRVVVQ